FGGAAVLMVVTGLVNAVVMPRISANAAGRAMAPSATSASATEDAEAPARARRFWEAYGSFLLQPQAGLVLSFMFFYKLGDIMMFSMSKPLLRDIGIDTFHRGIINGIQTAASIVGSLAGGAIIARYGIEIGR